MQFVVLALVLMGKMIEFIVIFFHIKFYFQLNHTMYAHCMLMYSVHSAYNARFVFSGTTICAHYVIPFICNKFQSYWDCKLLLWLWVRRVSEWMSVWVCVCVC